MRDLDGERRWQYSLGIHDPITVKEPWGRGRTEYTWQVALSSIRSVGSQCSPFGHYNLLLRWASLAYGLEVRPRG
jgi:hypothetical protein